jgi:hypothetical protein
MSSADARISSTPVRSFERREAADVSKAFKLAEQVDTKPSADEHASQGVTFDKVSSRASTPYHSSQGVSTSSKIGLKEVHSRSFGLQKRRAFLNDVRSQHCADGTNDESEMDPVVVEAIDNFTKALFEKGNGSFLTGWRKYFDDSGDSKISFGGFYRGLANMQYTKNPTELWRGLGRHDEEPATVSLREVDPWSADVLKVFKSWVVSLGGPAKVFDVIDVDDNHALTRDEWVRQVANLEMDLPKPPVGSLCRNAVDELFGCLDRDGAGVISPDEFLFLESDPGKRRALERHLEQRRFEKLAGYDAGAKHRPWRATNFLKQLNQQTNPIFGGKHFSQLTDDDMSLAESTTLLLHRSSITKDDTIFNRPLRSFTTLNLGLGSFTTFSDVNTNKPVWMLRALSELERADLASAEGRRADVRDRVRHNLSEIEATDEKLRELAGDVTADSSSDIDIRQPAPGSREGGMLKQRAKRNAVQPFVAAFSPDINCRKHSRNSTRCSTAESADFALRPVSSQAKAQKRRAAYSAPPTPEIQFRKQKHNPMAGKHGMRGPASWGHVYRPATSPDSAAGLHSIHSTRQCITR